MITLCFTDPHITEKTVEELNSIFEEILNYQTDRLIMLGDYFHTKKPTPKEILFGTKWAKLFLDKFSDVIFLRGNHDNTMDISSINYLFYLGIKVKDEFIDESNCYYGHFMTDQSAEAHGHYAKTLAELKSYSRVFLGHQHDFQKINDNAYHLGAVRYVSFGEQSLSKVIFSVTNENFQYYELKSIIPIRNITSIEQTKNLSEKNKVYLTISSFEQFKREAKEINEIKDKFYDFKLKLDFQNINIASKEELVKNKETKKFSEILTEGLKNIEDKDVKTLLEEQIELIKEI